MTRSTLEKELAQLLRGKESLALYYERNDKIPSDQWSIPVGEQHGAVVYVYGRTLLAAVRKARKRGKR